MHKRMLGKLFEDTANQERRPTSKVVLPKVAQPPSMEPVVLGWQAAEEGGLKRKGRGTSYVCVMCCRHHAGAEVCPMRSKNA